MPVPAGSSTGTGTVGTMTATWTDPDGTVWPLTDTSPDLGWFTRRPIAGWASTTYEYTTDTLPRGGDRVRFIRAQPGRITWPLHVWGEDHQQFVDRERALKKAFLSTAWLGRPGVLTVSRPDGTSRQIEAFYEDGWGGEGGEHWLFANPTLTLYCPDGYWRATTALTEAREFQAGVSFLAPFPQVSAGNVLGDTTITNAGDVTAWPTWTITGPASVITATNTTTNQTWILYYTLLAGETVTVTTLQPTVRGPVGQNLASALSWPTAYLWPLLPGVNAVNFSVAGAATGTEIAMSYFPRFEGA